jgi:hypothetical protein
MWGFAIGIERLGRVTVQRLQHCDARELDRAAMFGRVCQKLGGRQDCRRAALSCRDGLDEVRYRLAQGRQPVAILQHDRLGKTQGPGHERNSATEPGFKPMGLESFRQID